ncbi:outer membrane lipoprotein-sorting protein [Leeuwenhoekiella marinoflava]|uniref:outer membrane lipoprotein-sorting protein n=1 Tax=Leeuwenhoekiella marinoflava TaxID=988 RepID=UPI0030031EFA
MKSFFLLFFFLTSTFLSAQEEILLDLYDHNADEIIANYIEKTGGVEAWSEVEATKMLASLTQGDLTIPITIYNTKEGKQAVIVEYSGKKITQMAFDGATLWTTNFMTMEPEISSDDMRKNMMLKRNDFPSPLNNYKENGYTVNYEGTVAKDGVVTFKVKLTQEPISLNGEEKPYESYYFFDIETYYPIAIEATQMGQPISIKMNNYTEVEGLYFPFNLSQGGQPITIREIIINPEIDDNIFAFPVKD